MIFQQFVNHFLLSSKSLNNTERGFQYPISAAERGVAVNIFNQRNILKQKLTIAAVCSSNSYIENNHHSSSFTLHCCTIHARSGHLNTPPSPTYSFDRRPNEIQPTVYCVRVSHSSCSGWCRCRRLMLLDYVVRCVNSVPTAQLITVIWKSSKWQCIVPEEGPVAV